MQRVTIRWFTLCLFIALTTTAPVRGFAQDKSAEPKSETSKTAKKKGESQDTRGKPMPFQGKLDAVDKVNKTITIKGKERDRTFHVTSNTKLTKEGKPAILNDAVVGEAVAGLAKENADGKLEALSIRFGAKAPSQAKPKPEKAEKSEK
jgi:hypothetical protein